MPKVTNIARFSAFYKNAVNVFTQTNLAPYRLEKPKGSSLYRYVAYRGSMPQADDAGRTQWISPEKDLSNRWTGWGKSVSDSAQGLYFSNEFVRENLPFPELDHYMSKEADADAIIAYYKYEQDEQPKLQTAKASELRSMFLFTNKKPLAGIDLKLHIAPNTLNPLLEEIFNDIRTNNPEVLEPGDTVRNLYMSEGADFCRAVGNACLNSVIDIDYFETVSVRDGVSPNSVLKSTPGIPLASVDPTGRATFFLNGDKVGEGVYTVSDMMYNAVFEDNKTLSIEETPIEQADNIIKLGGTSLTAAGNQVGIRATVVNFHTERTVLTFQKVK